MFFSLLFQNLEIKHLPLPFCQVQVIKKGKVKLIMLVVQGLKRMIMLLL